MYKKVIDEIRQEHYTPETVNDAVKKINSVNNLGDPVKIIKLCQDMGFSIFQQKLPENICGYIAVNGELKERLGTDRIIAVNEKESSKRRRFTVAHELAHFLFDFDPSKIEFYNAFEIDHNDFDDERERLANRFAAEVLMPKKAFEAEYNKVYNSHEGSSEQFYETVQELSDKFLVPPKAVEVRIKKELNLHE